MSTETVRVRVFVSVAVEGGYIAYGCADATNEDYIEKTYHNTFDENDAGYWIEVDLPIPVKEESPGYNVKVTKAD